MAEVTNDTLLHIYRNGLLHDCVPFWLRHGLDRKFGGVLTSLDRDGQVIDTDKGVWQQGRFCWLMGKLYNEVEARDEWLEAARATGDFLTRYCVDPLDDRMWFHVTREGQPLRKRRYAFGESFAAIAFGELAKATGEQFYFDQALSAFQRFVRHNVNETAMGPKYTEVRPTRGLGVPMITINTAQELRNSIGLADANEWIDRSIETIQTFHCDEERRCVLETVGWNGEFLDHHDGRTLNPGHAIEGAWFILQEAKVRKDSSLQRLGLQMLDWMWDRGWDREYGGILYFVDVRNLPVQEYWHDMKFWWPQNETLIATLMAYEMTGQIRYRKWHMQLHEWAYQRFPDPEHGEWYGYLHRDGTPSSLAKGTLWKGPFHLPRMQLQCWRLLESLVPSE